MSYSRANSCRGKKDIYSVILVTAFTESGEEGLEIHFEDGEWKEASFTGTWQECIAWCNENGYKH